MTATGPSWSFRLLGPTVLSSDAGPVRIAAAKPRIVALLLLANANRPVSVEAMVDELWPERPPVSAVANVRTYLSKLRRLLPGRLSAEAAGYRLAVRPGELDLAEFTELIVAGRSAAGGRPQEAMASLRAALELWRGMPFEGETPGPALQARAAAEQDEYLGAVELYCDLLLGAGDPSTAQALLRDCIRGHPLRERLRGLLMLAVYQGGDPAGALACYQDARTTFAAELGIDPGPELTMLHQAVLRRDSRLLAAAGRGGERAVPPFQVPPAVADFVGRDDEIARLAALLRERATGAFGSCVTAIVSGMAGVGKTTLAIRAAHEVAEDFPGGCLYADLQHADGTPVPPAQILGRFLRALRVSDESLPRDTAERAALFRSLLAGREVLVLADNAVDEEQVLHLMPSAGCALVVTSRTLLTVPGATLLELRPLEAAAGVALLARIAGPAVVAAEPGAAVALLDLCGGLPLGIRAVGTRLALAPSPSLRRAVARLADEHRRLDHLTVGNIDIRASLALSYRRIRPDAIALLGVMSALPMRTFAPWLPAMLLGIAEPEAHALAEHLCDAQILTRTADDRYSMHDLVRLSANERPAGPPAPADPLGAAGRALLSAALTANQRLPGRPMTLPGPERPVPSAAIGPVEWFETELDGIGVLVPRLVAGGAAELAAQLATAVVNFCVLRGRADDWAATHEAIPVDAVLTPATAALLALSIGNLHRQRDDNAGALPHLRRAYRLYRRLGDPAGIAGAALSWCVAAQLLGRLRVARAAYDRAALLVPELAGTPLLGYIHLTRRVPLSPSPEAELAALTQALAVFETTNETWGSAEAHTFLAEANRARQRLAVAARHARAAMLVYTELHDHLQLTVAEIVLANIYVELGSTTHARPLVERCLARATRIGHRWGVASAQRTSGRIELHEGRPAAAIPWLASAVRGYQEMGLSRSVEIAGDLLARAQRAAADNPLASPTTARFRALS